MGPHPPSPRAVGRFVGGYDRSLSATKGGYDHRAAAMIPRAHLKISSLKCFEHPTCHWFGSSLSVVSNNANAKKRLFSQPPVQFLEGCLPAKRPFVVARSLSGLHGCCVPMSAPFVNEHLQNTGTPTPSVDDPPPQLAFLARSPPQWDVNAPSQRKTLATLFPRPVPWVIVWHFQGILSTRDGIFFP